MTEKAAAARGQVARLVILLVVALFVTLFVGGSLMIGHSQRALEGAVEQGQLATARSVASEAKQGVENASALIRAAAHRPGLVDEVRRGGSPRLGEILRNVRSTDDAIAAIVVKDLDGTTIAAEPPGASLAGPIEAEPATLPPRPVGNDARLALREPISSSGSSRPIGLMFAEISMRSAAPSVSSVRFGGTGSVTIVQRDGDILLAGDPMRVTGSATAAPIRRAAASGHERTIRYFSALLQREEVASTAAVEGQPWIVVVSQSTEEAFAPVARLRSSLIAVGLVALAAGGLLALWSIRTLRAHDERLRARLAEQDRLNTALEQFASRAAHDLRNPLATIRMAVDMLTRDEATEIQRTAAGIIERQSVRALELIDGLLALAKATGTPRLAVVELAPLVERVAQDANVGARIEDDGTVIADPVALQQVFANLMENAARYAATEGRPEVTVSRVEQNDGWVLSVSDRGPGVPEEEVNRIFKAFERGANAGGVGTGLGLAIVGAVAHAHGGRAWYEPRDGGGSVFSVFLPRPGGSSLDQGSGPG